MLAVHYARHGYDHVSDFPSGVFRLSIGPRLTAEPSLSIAGVFDPSQAGNNAYALVIESEELSNIFSMEKPHIRSIQLIRLHIPAL